MIDREILRQHPEIVKESLTKRGEDPKKLDQYLELEKKWRAIASQVEPLQAEKNKLSRSGKPSPAGLKKAQELSKKIAARESDLKATALAYQTAALALPTLVADDVPVGPG
jgi:seryl-tRNA synthetase